MTSDRGDESGKQRAANDNRSPDGPDAGKESDASGRLDAVVLSIAGLIGRRLAREDFAARIAAANDNAPKPGDEGGS